MKGQTLIEVMVALGVGMIILSAITTIVLTSLKNTEQTTSKDNSNSYAVDGLEKIRNMRDSDNGAFRNFNGNYCFDSSCNGFKGEVDRKCGRNTNKCEENSRGYIREVNFNKNSSECLVTPAPTNLASNGTQVNVKVSWKSNQCRDANNPYCHSIQVQSCLFPIIK